MVSNWLGNNEMRHVSSISLKPTQESKRYAISRGEVNLQINVSPFYKGETIN